MPTVPGLVNAELAVAWLWDLQEQGHRGGGEEGHRSTGGRDRWLQGLLAGVSKLAPPLPQASVHSACVRWG